MKIKFYFISNWSKKLINHQSYQHIKNKSSVHPSYPLIASNSSGSTADFSEPYESWLSAANWTPFLFFFRHDLIVSSLASCFWSGNMPLLPPCRMSTFLSSFFFSLINSYILIKLYSTFAMFFDIFFSKFKILLNLSMFSFFALFNEVTELTDGPLSLRPPYRTGGSLFLRIWSILLSLVSFFDGPAGD